MSERGNLLQGIKLSDYVKRICPKCKHKAEVSEALCPRCQNPLAAPVILPSFRQAVEAALHHALAGRLTIDLRGEIGEVLEKWPQLAPYLKQAASVIALEATITFGFPALFADCDAHASLYPDIRPRLGPARAFLVDQLSLAEKSLSRLRETLPPNPLAVAFADYMTLYLEYAQEKEKIRAEIGEGRPTSRLEATEKKLAGALGGIDKLVVLLGSQGPLWALNKHFPQSPSHEIVDVEWGAMLQAVGSIANFPLSIRGEYK